jgi:hypothetical protein
MIPISENYSLYTLHFTDDQVVTAHDKEDLEYMARKLIKEYKEWRLQVNMEKTKFMSVGGPKEVLEDVGTIEECDEYTYLGMKIDSRGRCEKEIQDRIVKAKKIIGALNLIL